MSCARIAPLQRRSTINETIVAEYVEALKAGAKFPPVTVFHDGAEHWLGDGFHRFHAHRHAGLDSIAAEIRTGTQRDAVLFSVGANAAHGLRRSNEDKRKAVLTLLEDAEWGQWSERKIAEVCGVSHPLVAGVRASLVTGNSSSEVTGNSSSERNYTTKHGTVATIDTSGVAEPNQRRKKESAADKGKPAKAGPKKSGKPADPSEVESLRAQLAEASTEARANPSFGKVDIARWVYVAETDAQAKKDSAEGLLRHLNHFFGGHQSGYLGQTSQGKDSITSALDYDTLARSTIIHGSPSTVVARIQELKAKTGLASMMLHYPPWYGTEKAKASLELFAREVMPRLR